MTFDFTSIKEKLLNKLADFSNLTITILRTSVYGTVLDVVSYAIDRLAFYFEFLYRESVWSKAQLRKSLVSQSVLLNYKPKRRTGPTGTVRVIGNPNYIDYRTITPTAVAYTGEPVQFNKWDILSSEDGNTTVYVTEDQLYAGSYTISQKNLKGKTVSQVPGNSDLVRINLGTPHGIPIGQTFSIRGTKNYNGEFQSLNSPYANSTTVVFFTTFLTETFTSSAFIYTGHIYLRVKQGDPKEFEYTAQGKSNESIQIIGSSIDNDEIQILEIDPVTRAVLHTYEIVDDLYLVNDDTTYKCSLKNADDFGSMYILFGDGIRSRRLIANERILVKYAETQGADGNIPNTSIIVKPLTTKLSIFGNLTNLSYSNDEEISDGAEIETVESIRANGKNLFFAGNRADTRQDYKAIIESHPSVHKALAYTEADLSNISITGNQSTVYISAISKSGNQLTVSEQTDISLNYLKQKHALTDIPSWQPIQIVNIRPFIDCTIKPQPISQMKDEVLAALQTHYASLNTDFNVSAHFSNIGAIIDDTDSILYHYTKVFHCEKSENYLALTLDTTNYQVAPSISSGEESDPAKQITLVPDPSLKILVRVKSAGVWYPETLVGVGINIGPQTGSIQTASGSDELITAQSGIVFDPNWSIVTGSINGDDVVASNANKVNFTIGFLTYQGEAILTDPASPLYNYILNPLPSDQNGILVRVMYKTRNGLTPAGFLDDVRLNHFSAITDINADDIIYKQINT
jgi:hypothetical protein